MDISHGTKSSYSQSLMIVLYFLHNENWRKYFDSSRKSFNCRIPKNVTPPRARRKQIRSCRLPPDCFGKTPMMLRNIELPAPPLLHPSWRRCDIPWKGRNGGDMVVPRGRLLRVGELERADVWRWMVIYIQSEPLLYDRSSYHVFACYWIDLARRERRDRLVAHVVISDPSSSFSFLFFYFTEYTFLREKPRSVTIRSIIQVLQYRTFPERKKIRKNGAREITR